MSSIFTLKMTGGELVLVFLVVLIFVVYILSWMSPSEVSEGSQDDAKPNPALPWFNRIPITDPGQPGAGSSTRMSKNGISPPPVCDGCGGSWGMTLERRPTGELVSRMGGGDNDIIQSYVTLSSLARVMIYIPKTNGGILTYTPVFAATFMPGKYQYTNPLIIWTSRDTAAPLTPEIMNAIAAGGGLVKITTVKNPSRGGDGRDTASPHIPVSRYGRLNLVFSHRREY